MKKIRAAVIGCGSISVMHMDSIAALDESELVAVCDIKAERAAAAAGKYHTTAYTDYHELFEKEKPDVVHLCLPHYLHTIVARDAFRAGIHVLSEKPMSIHYDDAVATVELAEKCNVKYGVIFQCRYNTPSMLVKKRIMDGRLGAVRCGRTTLTWYRPDNYYGGSDWKGTWDKEGGGVIIDQAIHSLDLANWFIDSTPIEVQSSLHNRNHKIMVVEDSAEGLIKYENGSLLSFYAMNNYFVDEPIEIRLLCENGKARLSYDEAVICQKSVSLRHLHRPVLCPAHSLPHSGARQCVIPHAHSRAAVRSDLRRLLRCRLRYCRTGALQRPFRYASCHRPVFHASRAVCLRPVHRSSHEACAHRKTPARPVCLPDRGNGAGKNRRGHCPGAVRPLYGRR